MDMMQRRSCEQVERSEIQDDAQPDQGLCDQSCSLLEVFGYAADTAPSSYHTWYLTPEGDGCRVVTDEVGNGESAVHLRETDEGLMHRGHDLWLATLKWISESK